MSQNPAVSGPSLAGQPKLKAKPALGITAGAEDVKYHAKYKELKKKVKEIEADNDRLHFKVSQAKRNIQRMKLERAILYERLSAGPPSPADERAPSSSHPTARELANDLLDPGYADYIRSQSSRVQNDGRPLQNQDVAMSGNVSQPKRAGGGGVAGHEMRHHLPSLPHLPPVQSLEPRQHSNPQEHRSSSSRIRSHQAPPPLPYQSASPYGEPLPPSGGAVFHHSPTQRRAPEIVDHSQIDVRSQHHTPMAPLSPRPRSSDSRSTTTGRIHNHQRLGPGTYINRDEERDRELERERELEWQRERDRVRGGRASEISSTPIHSPPFVHRQRQDYPDHHTTSRMRDEPGYYHDVPGGPARANEYPRLSRSGTPGSGSGGSGSAMVDGPSRPASRGPYYEHEQQRSYRLRPVSGHPEDADYLQDDSRSQSRDRGGFAPPQSETRSTVVAESRKRHRSEMDIDDGPLPEPSAYPSRLSDDRGAKRYHRDQLHQEADDDRMRP